MKKIFFTLMVMGSVAIAHADDELKRMESLCEQLGESAGVTMESHQIGLPLAKILPLSARLHTKPLEFFDKESTLQAYSTPRYNTANYQKKAIADFRDKRHVDCLKLISKNVSAVD